MGRNKTTTALAAAAAGRSVKERHQRVARDNIAVPRNLLAVSEKNIQSKHQSYFQFFANKDRKDKKLEIQVHILSARPRLDRIAFSSASRSPPTQTLLPVSNSCPAGIPNLQTHAKSCRGSKMP